MRLAPDPIVDYGDHFDGYASSVRLTAQPDLAGHALDGSGGARGSLA
ncbi:hypothetical protein [Methylobacterium sp. Leaf87]|nr:hypothetical protein [Methylobacterium sp. Leaf87]